MLQMGRRFVLHSLLAVTLLSGAAYDDSGIVYGPAVLARRHWCLQDYPSPVDGRGTSIGLFRVRH
jgi:hypothetical protein